MLDAAQHINLCRAHVRELRGIRLIETPESRKSGSKESRLDEVPAEAADAPPASSDPRLEHENLAGPSSLGFHSSNMDHEAEASDPQPDDLGDPADQIHDYWMSTSTRTSMRGGGSISRLPTGNISSTISRAWQFTFMLKRWRIRVASNGREDHITQLHLRGGASNLSIPTRRSTSSSEGSDDVSESITHSSEAEEDIDQQVSAILRNSRLQDRDSRSMASDARASFFTRSINRSSTDQDLSGSLTVTRQDIRASAEKILYTFVLPGAEREITLPGSTAQDMVVAIEEDGRDEPEVFDEAKNYVFQAMERDAFFAFLRMKALGNLIPPTLVLRLIIGLASLFAAFWAGFVLIFLDATRQTRTWLILPFTIGVYCLTAYQFSLDPMLAFLQLSEYTPFNFSRVREQYVQRLLIRRGVLVLVVLVVVDAALFAMFVLVPGKRL